jgi:hypothetical protein
MNIIFSVTIMLLCVNTSLSYSIVQTRPVIINSIQRPKISKLEKLKRKKEFEKNLAITTAIGTSIPAIDNIFSVSKYVQHVTTKVKQMFGYDVDTEDYGTIIKNMKPNDIWDYSVLFDKINDNEVLWVRISQDGKYAITIDRVNINVHYITTIPMHINSLIDKLIEMNIPFDIIHH